MRIALLYLGRKGAGPVYSIELAKAILKKGCYLLAIVSSYSDNIEDWRKLQEEYTFKLKEIKTYNSKKEFLLNSMNVMQYYKVCKEINSFKPEFIVSTMVHPWHNIIFPFLKKSIKRIKIIHDVIPHTGENSLAYKLLNYADIQISDYWITLTKTAKKELIKKGIEKNRIGIIPHANFSCYGSNVEIEKDNNELHYKIAFFGRINKYKGVDLLLEAFSNVKLKIPKLKLLIAGNGNTSSYQSYFEQYTNDLELHIHWIEDHEVASLLVNSDLLIIPYIEATQSGVIPLAFALGKPVIATRVGGIPEQVPPDCGVLVSPNNVTAIENAILDLYSNPFKIKGMGINALRYAKEELSWSKSAQLLLDFYNNFLNNENPTNHNPL